MPRLSAAATMRLFARIAIARTLNRSTVLNVFGKLRKQATDAADSADSAQSAASTPRTATLHRDAKQPLLKRIGGPALFGMMIMGWIIFCVGAIFTLFDFVRLEEIKAAVAADRPIVVEREHYDELRSAIERKGDAVNSIFGSMPSWLTAETEQVVRARIEARGISAFEPLDDAQTWRGVAAVLSSAGRREAFAAVALYLFLAYAAAIAMGIGLSSKSLTQSDPALLWLMQFPISRPVLFAAEVIENAVESPVAIIAASISVALAWLSGFSFSGGAAFALTIGLATALTTAAIRVALEIGLLQLCTRKQRGFCVSALSMTGGLMLFYVMFMTNSRLTLQLLPTVASHVPSVLFWNPLSQGFGTAAQLAGGDAAWWLAGPIGAALLCVAAVTFAVRLTATGLRPGQDSVREDAAASTGARNVASTSLAPGYFSGMVRKELLQVRRRPELAGQIMLAPLMIAFLLFLNGPNSAIVRAVQGSDAICAAIFAGATYLLLVAVSQMLAAELKTLWFLQCQPKSLAESIRVKSHVWGVVAIGMIVIAVGIMLVVVPEDRLGILARVPFMIAAVWLMAEIIFGVMSLGATIVNDQTIRFRRTTLFVPGVLTATAAAAVYSGDVWSQFVLLVVMGMLAFAVRQKQEAQLAWLSEPAETPPRRLYAMDGLVLIVCFLFFRDFLKPILFAGGLSNAEILAIAYCGSALVVGIGSWIWIKRAGFRILAERNDDAAQPKPARLIAPALALTCLVGFAWSSVMRLTIDNHGAAGLNPTWQADADGNYLGNWLLIFMVVIAAPIFEEWIFRGVLYRSLRRSTTFVAALIGTSLLFMVVHPLMSSVAVLTLGVVTAWLVERTNRLWSSIVVHVGYNAFVVVAWNVM